MMNTPRFAPLAAVLSLAAFTTGCAFDPNGASPDEDENIGTQQQAAIIYRGEGPGVAPGCGDAREKGGDGLCYTRCRGGFRGEVTRCIESGDGERVSCYDGSDGVGHCIVTTTCGTHPRESPWYAGTCRHSRPRRFEDRGVGVAPTCAFLERMTGKDGLCYPLTSTSGDITPAAPTPAQPPPAPAPAATGGAMSDAAKACGHTFDASGRAKMWVEDGFGGRCLTLAEYDAARPGAAPASPGDPYPGGICPFATGCDFKLPENPYHSPGNPTDHVPVLGQQLWGSPDPFAWRL